MIPVSLPSVEFIVLVLTFLTITIIWIVWTLLLCCRWLLSLRDSQFNKGAWSTVFVLSYLAVMTVALFTIGTFVSFKRQSNEYLSTYNRQYRPVLDTPQRLGGIDMPAGTKLTLAIADQREAFSVATFPSPVLIAGVKALRVERYLYIADQKHVGSRPFEPQAIYISGVGTSTHNGWHCDATYPLQFDLKSAEPGLAFLSCTLAEGNHIEGSQVPRGAEVRYSTGTVYVDGFIDQDRWIVDFPKDVIFEIDSLPLKGPVIKLDEHLKLYQVERASLARTILFGGVDYQLGTSARFNSRVLRPADLQVWLMQASSQQTISTNEQYRVHSRSGVFLSLFP